MFPLSAPGRRRRFLVVMLLATLLLSWPASVWAHPLGNFTINRYSRLEPGRDHIDLIYVVDMAEIAAFQERQRMDADSDGAISPSEQADYLSSAAMALRQNLHLRAGNADLILRQQSQSLSFPPGQGGLVTLRLTIHFIADLPAGAGGRQISYGDDNYADRLGWQEIVVRPGAGVRLLDSTAPADDASNELRNYPQDLLKNPLAMREAQFRFALAAAEASRPLVPSEPATAAIPLRANDPFTALINRSIHNPGALLLALALAFGWGAAHAFTPGHGKTVVGAYLVGSRGTARHALFLGLTTTLAHTAGVFILGFVTLFASRFILPEQLYPWLSVASGLLVVVLGFTLLRNRLAVWRHEQAHERHPHHTHDHTPAAPAGADEDGHYDHDHSHPDHGHHHHGHLPPDAQGERITWRSLLALGISGGLVPCPSALVVMLGAIALQRVGLGLLLIVAFSLGLAGVLTAIGVIFVHAGRLVERLPRRGRLLPALPVASAGLVVLLGLGITWRALIQAGAIPLTLISLAIR